MTHRLYFKSMMSSSEEAMSWKGLLPEPGLPSLSTTGSCSELVEGLRPSGLASEAGLSKTPDGILEERSHCQGFCRYTMEHDAVACFRCLVLSVSTMGRKEEGEEVQGVTSQSF